jgi:SAM-dependent methyltransferase
MGWHRVMVNGFLKACGKSDGHAVLEPFSREGHLAQLYLEGYKPAAYLGYDPNPSLVEVAKQIAPNATFTATPSACQLSGQYDVVLLVEKLQWMADPLRELECIGKLLKPGGGGGGSTWRNQPPTLCLATLRYSPRWAPSMSTRGKRSSNSWA